MNEPGVKLTTYFSERQRSGGRFLADALFDVYERHRMRTSVLLRGTAGFGQHHHLQTDRLLTLSETLPAVSIAVDERGLIERALRRACRSRRRPNGLRGRAGAPAPLRGRRCLCAPGS